MNNFTLNNTSVYLGGQCQWDIVINKNKDHLEIGGFQLSPISNNIPYNKRGEIRNLNDTHSDTLKQFCGNLKESFWGTDFCADTFIRSNDNNLDSNDIEIDSSLISGLKRTSDYSIYKKQFCFFQPLWLENIPKGSYLRFKFTAYPSGRQNIILGFNWVDLKILDSNLFDSFHNQFVNYFNNWITYVNITNPIYKYEQSKKYTKGDVIDQNAVIFDKVIEEPTKSDPEIILVLSETDDGDGYYYNKTIIGNNGNDRSMYIDLRNEKAYLSGVSTTTGQINNCVNCDYIVSNLLMNERPNIETDYILSTLFKSHNLINSQLFNFNFCFNLNDILSDFIIRQLYGEQIYIKCDVYLIDENENANLLENRTLFTNYNDIKKSFYNPFLFIDDVELSNETATSTDYTYKYKCNSTETQKTNVLDYLQDYDVKSVKDINKLNQNICHWNYTDIKDKNFNLYNGYQYTYYNYDINEPWDKKYENTSEPNSESNYEYAYTPVEIPHSNGISTYSFPDEYNENGVFSWIYPKQIIYINSHKTPKGAGEIYQEIIQKLSKKGNYGIFYKNSLSVDVMNETWGTNVKKDQDTTIDKICCVFINDVDWADFTGFLNNYYKVYKPKNSENLAVVIDSGLGVIITNNQNYLLLDPLIKICSEDENKGDDKKVFIDITNTLKKIKESILKGNDGYFYQFGKEICVGENDLNEKTYYKSDTLNTYLFRTGGKLSPALLQDSENYDLNGYYGYNNREKNIIKMESDVISNAFEITKIGGGWRVLLDTELNFIVKKDTYDNNLSLNDLIKSYLSSLYNITNKYIINDIFLKYFVSFDYEYEYEIKDSKTQVTTIYKVKLILR